MKVEFARALVTGASSGIGLAVCRLLSRQGAGLLMLARDPARLEGAAAGLSGELTTLSLDVADAEAVCTRLPASLAAFGPIDLLVNCAGMTHPARFESFPAGVFESIIATNLSGTWNVTRVALPFLRKNGAIVIVSSMAGLLGAYGYSAYSASKFALVGLAECLRQELKPGGIRVSVVCPADTDTPQLAAENRIKPAETLAVSGGMPVLRPEQVAAALLAGARRGRALIIPGWYNRLLYLVCRLFPGLYRRYADAGVAAAQRRAAQLNHQRGRPE